MPDAYYKRGLMYSRLNQNDKARESFELAIKNYPDSEASRLSKQVLDRLEHRRARVRDTDVAWDRNRGRKS